MSKKNNISAWKVGLGIYTGGLSLLFTGVHKKDKGDKKINKKVNSTISKISIPTNVSFEISTNKEISKTSYDIDKLNPNEIIFLNFINNKEENIYISSNWKYNYGIIAKKVINKFIKYNYIELINDLEENLTHLKCEELKNILKENNLSIKGKKQELINRCLDNIDYKKLLKIASKKIYTLTDKGTETIKNNYLYIINDRKHYNFTNFEIQEMYKNFSHITNNDKIWHLLNKKFLEHTKNKDWGLCRCSLMHMADLLFEENKFQSALENYITVIYYDLSGLNNRQ